MPFRVVIENKYLSLLTGALIGILCTKYTLMIPILVFVCLLLGILIFSPNLDILFLSILLPATALTGFYDKQLISLPFLDTFYGIYLLLSLVLICCSWLLKPMKYDISLAVPFFPYFVALLLSCLFSQIPQTSFSYLIKNYMAMTIYSVVLYNIIIFKEYNKKLFELVFVITFLIIFLEAFHQFATNSLGFTENFRDAVNLEDIANLETIRVASLFKHPFFFAEFNVFAFPFVMAHFMRIDTRWKKHLAGIFALTLVLTTVWTQHRFGIVLIMIQFVLYALLISSSSSFLTYLKKYTKFIIVLILLLLVILCTENGQILVQRIVDTFINPTKVYRDVSSLFVRIRRIQIGWDIFLQYPILGGGLGTNPELFLKNGWEFPDQTGGTHNLYMFLLSETGILGFVTFLYAICVKIKSSWKSRINHMGDYNYLAVASFVFYLSVLMEGMFSGMLSGTSIIMLFIFIAYAESTWNTRLMTDKPL